MQNRNSSISQDMNRIFDLKGESTDLVSDIIQPVVQLLPTPNIVRSAGASNNTAAIIYTTPADKDFYLCSYTTSLAKDVTATSNQTYLSVVIQGVQRFLGMISGITLTPQISNMSQSFPNPIKIDRNTQINILSTTNVATIRMDATITGFTVETTK